MKVGGSVNNEGLVFGYDADGFKFGGEPTTNLVPSAQHNGQFTTSNGWSTYNTNQYNGAQYFSIGSVGSITNNIVTLSSVGRGIRSFDVLRAQTTGGGVTAGTDYVIKKLSSNTFSLHQYNGSQNGSQGYINPDTGFFKVHDAYANDVRVPINATDFPTMWWGAPHLPNSGLIKEIVSNGGRRAGTNCMRLHAYRGDGVADGMAYGVYTPVTVGDIITMSVWIKLVDDRNPSGTLGYSTYFNAGYSAGATTFSNLTTDWKKYEYTWTSSNTFSFYSYWWPSGSSTPYAIDICDFQVEINKGHSTNFTTSTRSNTESLIDLGPNNAVLDTSNVQWTSEQYPKFDGSTTEITIPSGNWNKLTTFTLEAIFKSDGAPLNGYHVLFQKEGGYSGGSVYGLRSNPSGGTFYSMLFYDNQAANGFTLGSSTVMQDGTWYHVVSTYDSSYNWKLYINGVLENQTTLGNVPYQNDSSISVGIGDSRRMNGQLPVMRIYDIPLTDKEVYQNYLSYKPRFGLA